MEKKTILICEDDTDILQLLELILGRNFIVHTSENVVDIFNRVTTIRPDVILMDLWIPDIGGAGAVEVLKANEETRDIPVILVSATDKLENIAAEIGVQGFVKKPFSIDTCLQEIQKVLDEKTQDKARI